MTHQQYALHLPPPMPVAQRLACERLAAMVDC